MRHPLPAQRPDDRLPPETVLREKKMMMSRVAVAVTPLLPP
jgi:hypothetical protein